MLYVTFTGSTIVFDEIYIGGIQALGQLRYLGKPRTYGITIGRRFGD